MIKQKGILYDITLCICYVECYNTCKKQNYLPKTNFPFMFEKSITMLIVAVGIWVIGINTGNFPVFEHDEKDEGKISFNTQKIILSD